MIIRPVEPSDIKSILIMLQTSGYFDESSILHISQRLKSYFSWESDDLWFTAEKDGVVGVAYCAPEVMAKNVWNLLMLWIAPSQQRKGIGKALIDYIEIEMRKKETRLLLVETSSLEDFNAARCFYAKQGFICEARIRNYYENNEDKVILIKDLH